MLVVAALAACAGSSPAATMTATRRPMRSAASAASLHYCHFRPAIFDRHIAPLDIPGLARGPAGTRPPRFGVYWATRSEEPNHRHRRSLRTRCERPCDAEPPTNVMHSRRLMCPQNRGAKPTISFGGSRNRVVQHSKIGWSGSGSGQKPALIPRQALDLDQARDVSGLVLRQGMPDHQEPLGPPQDCAYHWIG